MPTSPNNNIHDYRSDSTEMSHQVPILPPPFLIRNENRVNQSNQDSISNSAQTQTQTQTQTTTNSNSSQQHSPISYLNNMLPNNNMIMLPPLSNPYNYSWNTTNGSVSSTQGSATNSSNQNSPQFGASTNSVMGAPSQQQISQNAASNTVQYQQMQQQQQQQQQQQSSVLNSSSNLPPLFRLVFDSTLPVTNYSSPLAGLGTQSNPTNSPPSYSNSNKIGTNSSSSLNNYKGFESPLPTRNNSFDVNPLAQHSYSSHQLPTPPNYDSNSNSSTHLQQQSQSQSRRRRANYSSNGVPTTGSNPPRKKRECPVCHNYFSNLTTHKSIHNKESKPFSCSTCNRAFKRLNDLIRHEKCHLSKLGEWEFQCPFHSVDTSVNGVRTEACHHTGYFTRCDTYKNHLKAIHFKYPPNTLKSDRFKVSGHCKECGMHFDNVQDWLINHIENNSCSKIINSTDMEKL